MQNEVVECRLSSCSLPYGLLGSILLLLIQNLCKVVASDPHNQVTNLHLTFINNVASFVLHHILDISFQYFI